MSNSVNIIKAAPYLNRKDFCVISIVLNSLLFFTILYYFAWFVNTFHFQFQNSPRKGGCIIFELFPRLAT